MSVRTWPTEQSEREDELYTVIERVGRFTWRPWSSKVGGVLGVRDGANLKGNNMQV
jgi:hypothetical protein